MTSPSSAAARPATRRRSAPRSSARGSSASRGSRRSAAPACASGASRRRRGCRRRTRCTTRARRSRSSASASCEPTLDFPQAAAWKDGVVKQMTGGVAALFKANGVEWVQGAGRFTGPNTIAVEGAEDVTFTSAIVATGSYPDPPADPRARLGRAASTRPACSRRPRCRAGSSCSAAGSSAASSPRSSTASAAR